MFLFGVLLAAALAALAPLTAAIRQPVRIDSGLVSGIPGSDPAVTVFKGIPFAAAPVGELRWRAPKPVAAWEGVRKADRFSSNCIQNCTETMGPWTWEYWPHGPMSEDCLYMNIWTAAGSAADKRPVLLYIHGGGFNSGSGSVPVYDGESLAKKGLIVVNFNYRVGVLGFYTHPELSKESDHGVSGNYGMLDQVAALEWVKKNVAAFGGDPQQVTIMGQSAGAGSVHNLTASPLAKGLFARAIADSTSGVRTSQPVRTMAQSEQSGVEFATAKNARSLKELRALPSAELQKPVPGERQFVFRPVVDGWFLPQDTQDIIVAGKQNDVPTLTGLNWDEGSSNASYGKIPAAEFAKQVRERFGALAETVLKLYPVSSDEEAGGSQKALAREQAMVSMYLWASIRSKTAKTKAFTYIFNHPQPGPDRLLYGTFHSGELAYVFDNLHTAERPWTAADRRLAVTMSGYWMNFIKTGDPNGGGLPSWPAFDAKSVTTMELGDKMAARPVASSEKVELFRKYFGQ